MTERARSKTIQEEPPEHPTDMRDGTWSRLGTLAYQLTTLCGPKVFTSKRRGETISLVTQFLCIRVLTEATQRANGTGCASLRPRPTDKSL